MTQISEAEVRDLAYHLWIEAGQPDGSDLDFWLAAEQRLMGTAVVADSPAPEKAPAAKSKATKAASSESKPKAAARGRAKAK
ncbi:DUF2934 domain-containing protein [Magnetospirillum molischianum]|uniref:DUF2934 domain-containing protein n=1 Tax=Magnetospirillum molischianum DSM 120 TaxID=1150626 RepID=H8FTZ6_MAGML|nr:DUF2934 domain-containing protein [Magnetospirillum molischianum]CCG41720.1 conserved hypothetical protein [Magnetospirillum molischianum DSM 120]